MNGNYTKHIYIGSQRIVSKLGDLDSYGSDPRRIEYAGANVDGAKVDYKAKYTALQQTIKDRYAAFEVPYYGRDNDDYVNGQGFCCDDSKTLKSFTANANDNPELYQYYYHSDHLGSSSLITNLDGETVQHIEYVPFGEVFIEERNNTWNTPYLFNAKELDEETGLYYYGARYYDPRTSVWLSVDAPLINGYYLDGNHHGGVYNAFNLNPYLYCRANPVLYFDPNGNQFKAIREWWYDSGADLAIRALGCLQMVGGACEAVVGGVGGVVTAETVLGTAAGYAVLINGIDNTLTGAKQMWTGEVEQTLLHQGIAEGSKLLGADEQTAENIATYGELFGTAGLNIANTKNILNVSSNKLIPTIQTPANQIFIPFRSYTVNNFRHNLGLLTGNMPINSQAHHVFPQAFRTFFSKIGLNIDNPAYGAWWTTLDHQKNANAYNSLWKQFIKDNPNATVQEVLNEGKRIASQYGLTTHF